MQLPDTIPAHQLLTPEIARVIYACIAEVATAALEIEDNGKPYNDDLNYAIGAASEQIQQTVVDFVQAEIERAAHNGHPFRLVARRP